MILGDVEETVTTIELDEETFEEIFKVCNILIKLHVYITPALANVSVMHNLCLLSTL